MGFFLNGTVNQYFFIIIFFLSWNLLLKCKSLSHDRLLPLTQQMSTFLTLMKHDVLKEHIKIRKNGKTQKKWLWRDYIQRFCRQIPISWYFYNPYSISIRESMKKETIFRGCLEKKQEHFKAIFHLTDNDLIYIVVRYIGYLS